MKHKVPIVITSLGANKDVNDAVHSYGGISVVTDATCRNEVTAWRHGAECMATGQQQFVRSR